MARAKFLIRFSSRFSSRPRKGSDKDCGSKPPQLCLSCNSCNKPYAGGCCCCCRRLTTADCCKWHKQIYMPHSTSRLPGCLAASCGTCFAWQEAWALLKVQSVKLPRSFGPLEIDVRLAHPFPYPNALLLLLPSSYDRSPVTPLRPSLRLSVSLLCLRRTKPTTIALDSFYRCLNCCLCRAWLFAKGRIICLARSVRMSVCMCIFCICSSDWFLLFKLSLDQQQLLKYITIPLTALGVPLMIFQHFRKYFLCKNGLGN